MNPLRLLTTTAVLAAVYIPSLFAADAPEAKPPRAARSVHLGWQAPDAELFYLEATVEKTTTGSYFMACGWNTGYFGIQDLGNGRKVVIFSVWDPTKGNNASEVPVEKRVELLHQGDDVRIKRFGGEGTGGQSMADFDWAIGQTNRFIVRGQPDGTKTAYSGYLFDPSTKAWRHLVTFRTESNGSPLKGLYSFVEDFRRDTKSVGDNRRASFGNSWVKTTNGEWLPLTKARFTASGASWESKENIDAGPTGDRFYLSTGGAITMSRELRSMIELPAGTGSAHPSGLPEFPAKQPEPVTPKPVQLKSN